MMKKTPSPRFAVSSESEHDGRLIAIATLFIGLLCDCFKPRQRPEAEILALRHQLNILQQRAPRRLRLRWVDRVRWHRMGYAAIWQRKSRRRGGRPRIGKEVRDLIRRLSMWGAPRIRGELLKLGINVAQSTVSVYMVPRQGRPLQSWKTFLRNHAKEIASIDLFVVPTIPFRRLFVCLILGHQRRQLLGFAVTEHPTAEWLARQSLRWRLQGSAACHGNPGSADLVPLALADGHTTLDRIGPARVHRPFDRVQRRPSSANSCELCHRL
jgi:hypothetical protein